MIEFECNNCRQKFRVPDALAAKRSRCPNCKAPLTIPGSFLRPGSDQQQPLSDSKSSDPYDPALLQLPEQLRPVSRPADIEQLLAACQLDTAQPLPQRKHPWPIDIFLYPFSAAAMLTLSVIFGVPLLLDIFAGLVGPFFMFVMFPGMIIKIILGLYLYWYLAECVRDSAAGGIRAPDTIAKVPGIGDLFGQVLKIFLCLLILAAPALLYYQRPGTSSWLLWLLLVLADVLFPMALLAVIQFDSIFALNPLLLLGSIFRTIVPYLGLVLMLTGVVLLLKYLTEASRGSILARAALRVLSLYLALVGAHLLGRFYFRYKQKLNWDL